MLKVNNSLVELGLEWNCIGIWDQGVRAIADSMAINTSIVSLDLRNNKIGPQGAQSLALGLRHNTALQNLGLLV